jgi:hypothetical protein
MESPKKTYKRTPTSKPPTLSRFDSSDDERVVVSKNPDQPVITYTSTQEQDDSSRRTPTLQQEEDDLMDRLDAEITKAEEDDLMERLDQEIGRHEEEDLMERLRIRWNDCSSQAARSEWASGNSLVEGVETVEEAKNDTDG